MYKTKEQRITWLNDQLDKRYEVNTLIVKDCGGTLKSFADIECEVCGYTHHFNAASNLIYKARKEYACPNCEAESKKRIVREPQKETEIKSPLEQIQDRLNNEFEHNSLIPLEYGGKLRSPLKVKCLVCGFEHTYNQAQELIYKKNKKESCPQCAGPNKPRITLEEAQKRIDEKFGENEFQILKYEKASDKITLKHVKCGFCFTKRNLFDVEKMLGCPKCESYSSRGEKEIAGILLKWNIPFETQKRFVNLIGEDPRGPLRFDFCIMKNGLPLLIEFDGPQHFQSGYFGNNEQQFQIQVKNDEKKNQFCQQNNYPLLRIPYWSFKNIKNIIKDFLILNDYPLEGVGSSDSETLNTNSEDIVSSHMKV